MDFLTLSKERYSCRKFSDKKVEKELIDKIIEAGITAPTAVNKQPFKIWSMDSEESKENIRKITSCSFGADTFLVVGAKKDDAWTRGFDNKNFAEVDASIVATHMMMEITDLGLASTWVGFFDAPQLKKFYPQMEDYELIAIFPIGYASDDEGGAPSPRHCQRKSKETLVEVL